MVDYGHGLGGFILTLISLIHAVFALIICLIVIISIIYHQYRHRLKREERITLILSANIYLFLLIFLVALIPVNIETLMGDVYGNTYDSSLCIFKGYFSFSICCSMYHAFVTQGFFRLSRIIYSNYRWLQFYWLYVLIGPVQVVLAFALMSPPLLWHDVIYLPKEYYCHIPFTRLRASLWVMFSVYGIPVLCLSAMCARITMFIRQHSNTQTLVVRQRQNRDLLAIRRILINLGILITLGLPSVVFLLILYITGVEHPLIYRMVWIEVEVGMAVLSVEMVFTTPQLKNIFLRQWSHNRVAIVTHSIQMRTIGNMQ